MQLKTDNKANAFGGTFVKPHIPMLKLSFATAPRLYKHCGQRPERVKFISSTGSERPLVPVGVLHLNLCQDS